MEDALGDPGEDLGHGIYPELVRLHHLQHSGQAVLGELPAEEAVGEEHLADHVDEVEAVGEEHLYAPGVVDAHALNEVGGQVTLRLLPLLPVENEEMEAANDPLDLVTFSNLVDNVGDVEHDALEEEHKGDPLVVGLQGDLVRLGVEGANARL